ncbi:MAG: PrsW family glutamic-type intramembrane protease [bacterium]|nr:PrsW family glutamic-type intramembrane protease [bacterium]
MMILLAFGPGIFWLWYFYRKDRLEPEPKMLVLQMFVLGMLVVIPCALLELLYPWNNLFLLVVGAPVIEEMGKFLVVRYTVYKDQEFDEPMDGIIYAAAVALGFASLENLMYIVSYYLHAVATVSEGRTWEITFGLSFSRALLSVPGHVLFSSMWGFAMGVTKFMPDPTRSRPYVQGGLVLAIVLHGIFNLICGTPIGAMALLVFVFLAWRMVLTRIEYALRNSPYA